MSGPSEVGAVHLTDGLASVLVDLMHEQALFMVLVPVKVPFLVPEVLVPPSAACLFSLPTAATFIVPSLSLIHI